MSKLNDDQIILASLVIGKAFEDDTIGIVSHLNQIGKLDEFLKYTGLKSSVRKVLEDNLMPTKKVLVVGQGLAKESEYKQSCMDANINPSNFEFYLDYHDAKKMDFEKYKNNPKYGGIIVGPMDHSGPAKGNYTSIIDRLENEPGFPKVVRGNEGGELKLSLHDFYSAVLKLFNAGALTV